MHRRHAAILLIVLAVAFAENEVTILEPTYGACEPGYADSFDVQVLDGSLRGVEGAGVTATFDRGATFGDTYFTTKPRYTDAAGRVHFDITNQGTTSRAVDCNLVLFASVGGANNTTHITATQHGSVVNLPLTNAHRVLFYMKDGNGSPLANATVTIANFTKTTGPDGLAGFTVVEGSHSYLGSYLDGGQAGQMDVEGDVTFDLMLRASAVSMEITDEFGAPLPVALHIFNRSYELPDGRFRYPQTYGADIPYRVEYRGIVKEGRIVPAKNPDAKVAFDLHSPVFGNIKPELSEGRYSLGIPVSDPGEGAAGVDFQSLVVTYRLEPTEPTTPWNQAVTFTSGREVFTAEFPEFPNGSIVSFRAEISDNAGNKATIDGKFSTLAPEVASNNTQNQTDTQQPPPEQQGIPLLYLFVGVIVACLVVYVVFRIKTQGGGSA